MKNKWFDIGLYWQGLRRLRVLGLAFAILCICICVLVPTTRWSNGRYYMDSFAVDVHLDGEDVVLEDLTNWEDEQFYRENGCTVTDVGSQPEKIADRHLLVPMIVMSYGSPLFVLVLFDFLNKRKESDFYHAIPLRRECVYTSLMAALLTWIFGTFIISALSTALVWALCPFVTFSFGGLLSQLMCACLNAALLASFASVAVSLTGTSATSFVATLLVFGSWRFILGIGYLCLSDMLNIIDPETFLGGYLKPGWLLPFAMVTQIPSAKVWYAGIVTLLMFALGGVLYSKRKSELAGRSVPGRWVHILLRTLMTLPAALLLTYQLLCQGDLSVILILFVATLLIFYLYELLTTKSVRRMVKATPWFGLVIGLCLVFVGVMYTAVGIENNERTDADRVAGVTVADARFNGNGFDKYVPNTYEMKLIQNSMSDDPRAIALVCQAWEKTQANGYGPSSNQPKTECHARIQLKSGRVIERRLYMDPEKYAELIVRLWEDIQPYPVPSKDQVYELYIYQPHRNDTLSLSGEWRTRFLTAMQNDYANMPLNKVPLDSSYSYILDIQMMVEEAGKEQSAAVINGSWRSDYISYSYHYELCEGMKETVGVLYDLFSLPTYGRAHFAREALDAISPNSSFEIVLLDEQGFEKSLYWASRDEKSLSQGRDLLLAGIRRAEIGTHNEERFLMYIEVENPQGGRHAVFCPIQLTPEEYSQLLSVWTFK